MNTIAIVREALETHTRATTGNGLTQKCAGCPWVGWDHNLHVAKIIAAELEPTLDDVGYTPEVIERLDNG